MRRLLWIAFMLASIAVLPAVAAQDGDNRPNIVIIIADDMGYSDAGCYGGEIRTPNLDRMAAEGLRFTTFYNTGRCWPSRSALMTGYYPQQIRMDPPKGRLPQWTRLLPHYLKPLGYRSYHSGKWHVRGAPLPVKDGGFDRSYMVNDQDRFFSPRNTWFGDERLPPVEPGSGYYATTVIADHALEFLEGHAANHGSDPFLLYLAYTAPHFPVQALQKDIDRYRDSYLEGWDKMREKRYQRLRKEGFINSNLPDREPSTVPSWNLSEEDLQAKIGPGEAGRAIAWNDLTDAQKRFQATKMAIHAAMVDRVDQETGRVLAQLRKMGAYDATVIFFVSDNGASAEQIIRGDLHDPDAPPGSAKSYLCLGPGFSTAANTPFRRHKSWVHEGGISTPFIVKWAKGISARGELRRTPGHVIDVVPTVLEITGAKPTPKWNGVDAPALPGRSLAAAFPRETTIDRPYIFFSHIGNQALRVGDWKLVKGNRDDEVWELFDLSTDRAESKNLAGQHPDRVREMSERWKQLETEFLTLAGEE